VSVCKIDNMSSNNFALTTLSQNPEYFEEVISLIEEEFHYSDAHSYEKDFAPLVDPLNFENCYFYIDRDSNTVAAHLAVCIRTLVKNDAEVKVALIGGIVTNKKYRGKNLFKNLMNHAIQTYSKEVALFILWSDLEGLYEKFSFYRTGGLIESGKKNFSSSERPMGYEKTTFSVLSEREFKSVILLYHSFNEKYFFTVKREDKDWSIIREMNSVDLYIKKNAQNEIEKYFCINKGRDLSNIIYEISCRNMEEYQSLIRNLEVFKMWLPETEIDKLSNKEMFYTAFIKLGGVNLLNKFLNKISSNELKITKMEDDFVEFCFKKQTYNVTSRDFLQYLFGPKPIEEFQGYKLSLYVSGLDSI
jgi:predicted acetyltransferase